MPTKNKKTSLVICPTFDKDTEKFMLSRGLDRLVLANKRTSFDIEEVLTPFKPHIQDVKTRTFGLPKQLKVARKLLEHPTHGSGVYMVNSFPSDMRAKLFAAQVMYVACKQFKDASQRAQRFTNGPLWVRLLGINDYKQFDAIKEARPNMLILSNINDESTPLKVERLRDLLDEFNNIPKLVVTAGSDPLTFMMRRVFYPVNGAMRIGSNERINLLDM